MESRDFASIENSVSGIVSSPDSAGGTALGLSLDLALESRVNSGLNMGQESDIFPELGSVLASYVTPDTVFQKRGRPRKGEVRLPKVCKVIPPKYKKLGKEEKLERNMRRKSDFILKKWTKAEGYQGSAIKKRSICILKDSPALFIYQSSTSTNHKAKPLFEWLDSHNILNPSFLSTEVQDEDDYTIRPEILAFKSHFIGSDIDSDPDFLVNASAPITSTVLLSEVKSANSMQFIIGTSRIGWPTGRLDYEKKSIKQPTHILEPLENDDDERSPDDIGVGFGVDYTRNFFSEEKHPNLLQVWSIGENLGDAKGTGKLAVQMNYFIGLSDKGSVLSIAEGPKVFRSNSQDDSDNSEDELVYREIVDDMAKDLIAEGTLLAVLCGGGECLILLVTKVGLGDMYCHRDQREDAMIDEERLSYERTLVLPHEEILVSIITAPVHRCVSSIAWNPHSTMQLCCGLSDGSVAIYSIEESFLKNEKKAVMLVRFADSTVDFRLPVGFAVTAAAISPHHPNLIASGSFDCNIKIWNIGNISSPIYENNVHKSVGQLAWDPCGLGVMYSDLQSTSIYAERCGLGRNVGAVRKIVYEHRRSYGCVWGLKTFLYDGQSIVASVASDGTVRSGIVSKFSISKPFSHPPQLFQITSVTRSEGGEGRIVYHRRDTGYESQIKGLEENHSFALHSIDVQDFSFQNEEDDRENADDDEEKEKKLLFLYGGAAGIARIHCASIS